LASKPVSVSATADAAIRLSLVVPCFNEEAAVPLFYAESLQALAATDAEFELLFVDDGSMDKTLDVLRGLAAKDSRVHYLSFSRNFGKEAAMLAGLQTARGEYIAVLDADGQHPPQLVPQMLEAVCSGEADCAVARRNRKGDSPARSFLARRFYALMQKITGMEIVDGAGDFRLMSRPYLEAILALPERSRFSKGIFPWIGFKTKWFEYENVERAAGSTKWSFGKLLLYALDGIAAFSSKPLAIGSFAGIVFFLLAMALTAFVIIRRIVWGSPVDGWASTMCVILFGSGVQCFTMGIMGQYIAKIYTEVKQRPHYVIKEAQ
jgi:glycosyltransferase involved in cell wall biosynthesis